MKCAGISGKTLQLKITYSSPLLRRGGSVFATFSLQNHLKLRQKKKSESLQYCYGIWEKWEVDYYPGLPFFQENVFSLDSKLKCQKRQFSGGNFSYFRNYMPKCLKFFYFFDDFSKMYPKKFLLKSVLNFAEMAIFLSGISRFQGTWKEFPGNFRQKSQFLGKFPTKFFCRNRLYLTTYRKNQKTREKKDPVFQNFGGGFQDFQGRLFFRKFSSLYDFDF
jgi:hypothetical protein